MKIFYFSKKEQITLIHLVWEMRFYYFTFFLLVQSRQPFMTICQVSTVDGSPRLERQVQKLTIQMHHQCPTLTAAGYFTLGRNMILKVGLYC